MPSRRLTRLTESGQFGKVYRQGIASRSKLFSVHAFPNETGTARLGLSVSRKVGSAVTRNTVKRRLREIFSAHRPMVAGSYDFVVSARPAAGNASFDELNSEFVRALQRLGVLGEPDAALESN